MTNEWAIKKWSMVLSDKTMLDKPSFLICSILPLAYIEFVNNENLLLVNVADVRKYSNVVKAGFDLLVKSGYAKWIVDSKNKDPNEGHTRIAVGTTEDFYNVQYYFELRENLAKETVMVTNAVPTEDWSGLVAVLDEWHSKYTYFCKKSHIPAKSVKAFDTIKAVLTKAKTTGKIASGDLLNYLACVNAMICEHTDIVLNSSPKALAVAKGIIAKTKVRDLMEVVPYFVEHYPSIAKSGYEETNIYMLSVHVTNMVIRMRKAQGGTTKSQLKGYDDDDKL